MELEYTYTLLSYWFGNFYSGFENVIQSRFSKKGNLVAAAGMTVAIIGYYFFVQG